MRPLLAAAAAALAAAMGGVILGEYDLTGPTPYIATGLFGIAIGEVALSVAGRPGAGRRPTWLIPLAAACTAGGLVASIYKTSNHFRNPAHVHDWAALALGVVLSALWVRSGLGRGPGTPASSPRSDGTSPSA